MARIKRADLFAPSEVAIVHVMSRVVRHYFLLGQDPATGKNFDHRKDWIEQLVERFASQFGIDLIAYSLMSNHMHLVLRSRPDVVDSWNDTEVAYRWLMICPQRKHADGFPKEPTDAEIDAICQDEERLTLIRNRLSDISWWMRLLNQRIARRANLEEEKTGRFWEGRFKAVRLLDEAAVLACATYVDLNPIRAALAETIEESDFTSIQQRVRSTTGALDTFDSSHPSKQRRADDFLSPVHVNERESTAEEFPRSTPSRRCSNKGFTTLTEVEYLELVDWTARHAAPGKLGVTPPEAPHVLERLGIASDVWFALSLSFGTLFNFAAGPPQEVKQFRARRQSTKRRAKHGSEEESSVEAT